MESRLVCIVKISHWITSKLCKIRSHTANILRRSRKKSLCWECLRRQHISAWMNKTVDFPNSQPYGMEAEAMRSLLLNENEETLAILNELTPAIHKRMQTKLRKWAFCARARAHIVRIDHMRARKIGEDRWPVPLSRQRSSQWKWKTFAVLSLFHENARWSGMAQPICQ